MIYQYWCANMSVLGQGSIPRKTVSKTFLTRSDFELVLSGQSFPDQSYMHFPGFSSLRDIQKVRTL